MLTTFELQFKFIGDWHIGVTLNGQFQKYIHNQHLVLELDNSDENSIQLTFLGKDYLNPQHLDNVCEITGLYINQLKLNNLIQQSVFKSDNLEYQTINGCDYINLNGIWSINLNSYTVRGQLEKILNV